MLHYIQSVLACIKHTLKLNNYFILITERNIIRKRQKMHSFTRALHYVQELSEKINRIITAHNIKDAHLNSNNPKYLYSRGDINVFDLNPKFMYF